MQSSLLWGFAIVTVLLAFGCGNSNSNTPSSFNESVFGSRELENSISEILDKNALALTDSASSVNSILAQIRIVGEVEEVKLVAGLWGVKLRRPISVLPYDQSDAEIEIAKKRQDEINLLLETYGNSLTVYALENNPDFFTPAIDPAAPQALENDLVQLSLRGGFSAAPLADTFSRGAVSSNGPSIYGVAGGASVGCSPTAPGCGSVPSSANRCSLGAFCTSYGGQCQSVGPSYQLECCLNRVEPNQPGLPPDARAYWRVNGCQCPSSRPVPVRRGVSSECCPLGADITVPGCACPSGQGVVNGRCQVCPAGQGPNSAGNCTVCPANQVSVNGVCQTCPAGQTIIAGVCVFAGPAQITYFDKLQPMTCPGNNTLVWAATNASSCKLEFLDALNSVAIRSWDNLPASGTKVIDINDMATPAFRQGPNQRNFRLTCIGGTSSDHKYGHFDVVAQPAAISTFQVPVQVQVEGSATVTWSSIGSSVCRLYADFIDDNFNRTRIQIGGNRAASGSILLTNLGAGTSSPLPNGFFSYPLELECDSACPGAGTTVERRVIEIVDLPAPTVAMPAPIFNGGTATISWTSIGGGVCDITNAVGQPLVSGAPAVGSVMRTFQRPANAPANTFYEYGIKVTCRLPGGHFSPTTSAKVMINADLPPMIYNFTTSPQTIIVGQSTTISWTSNAASCRVYNTMGALVTQGAGTDSRLVNFGYAPPTSPYNYLLLLRCEGASGLVAPDYAGLVTIFNNP